jgi:hypothetical protein
VTASCTAPRKSRAALLSLGRIRSLKPRLGRFWTNASCATWTRRVIPPTSSRKSPTSRAPPRGTATLALYAHGLSLQPRKGSPPFPPSPVGSPTGSSRQVATIAPMPRPRHGAAQSTASAALHGRRLRATIPAWPLSASSTCAPKRSTGVARPRGAVPRSPAFPRGTRQHRLPPRSRRAGPADPGRRRARTAGSAPPLRRLCPSFTPGSCVMMTPVKASWATCRSTPMPLRSASTGLRPTIAAPDKRLSSPPPRTMRAGRAGRPPSSRWSSTACAASRLSTPPPSRPSRPGWRRPSLRTSPSPVPWLPGPRRFRPWPCPCTSAASSSIASRISDHGFGSPYPRIRTSQSPFPRASSRASPPSLWRRLAVLPLAPELTASAAAAPLSCFTVASTWQPCRSPCVTPLSPLRSRTSSSRL